MRTRRASTAIKLVLALVCVASIWLTPSAPAVGSTAATKVSDESLQAYEQQLANGQIAVARFSGKAHVMHLTLKDGRHVRVIYTPGAESKLRAALQAKGVSLPAPKKAAGHHTLRDIGIGVIVLLILIAIGVVLVLRRRRREEQY
jgi:ATP-dependent Zn protease